MLRSAMLLLKHRSWFGGVGAAAQGCGTRGFGLVHSITQGHTDTA